MRGKASPHAYDMQVHLRKYPMPRLIWLLQCATWIATSMESLKTLSRPAETFFYIIVSMQQLF